MKKLVFYGAGGFAREMIFMLERINRIRPAYDFLGMVVDEPYYRPGQTVFGFPVLGTADWLFAHRDEVYCTCVVGRPTSARERIQETCEARGVRFETLVSPDVELHSSVQVGAGSILCRNSTYTVDIRIGKGTVINEKTGLGHDAVVGDYCTVFGNVSITGGVVVGNRVTIGTKAFIAPGMKVGDDAVIAAGSMVFTKVRAGTHVLGNPAKRINL